ncbi:MAG TPA: helix-turn-helix domain-containing protein [Desulfomonilaceae bacterium]|nr:helix-turn-helix domain-containing protein [Desulfomonilaceae bacterium]
MTLEPLRTTEKVADLLRTSVRTVRQACEEGELDYVMVSEKERRLFIPKRCTENWRF